MLLAKPTFEAFLRREISPRAAILHAMLLSSHASEGRVPSGLELAGVFGVDQCTISRLKRQLKDAGLFPLTEQQELFAE